MYFVIENCTTHINLKKYSSSRYLEYFFKFLKTMCIISGMLVMLGMIQ